jgi:hypothetical protein
MATPLTLEQIMEFAKLKNAAAERGDYAFKFQNRWWVLGENGGISFSYPEPEGQTHEVIANMRLIWPSTVKLLQQPHVQNQLLFQEQMVNWDAVNDMERQCGLPETPCPDSPVTKRLGLTKSQ